MLLFRVDNRLVHGQIIEAWLPYMQAKHLVVANDALASDALRQQIVSLAIPNRIQVHFVRLGELAKNLQKFNNEKTLVLLENCADLALALEQDIAAVRVNIGNLHFGPEKIQLLPHIFVTMDELKLLQELNKRVILEFRSVPTEKPRGLHEL